MGGSKTLCNGAVRRRGRKALAHFKRSLSDTHSLVHRMSLRNIRGQTVAWHFKGTRARTIRSCEVEGRRCPKWHKLVYVDLKNLGLWMRQRSHWAAA